MGASMPAAKNEPAALLGSGVSVALAALLGLHLGRSGDAVAAFWPANALLLVFVIRGAPAFRPAYLAAGLAGNLVAALLESPHMAVGAALSLVNVLEVGLAAWLVAKRAGTHYRQWRGAKLTEATFWAAAVAPAFGATVASLAVARGGPGGDAAWLMWYGREALAMVTLLPLGISLDVRALRAVFTRDRLLDTALCLGSLLGVDELIFGQERFPALFVIFPVLVTVAFRLGVSGPRSRCC